MRLTRGCLLTLAMGSLGCGVSTLELEQPGSPSTASATPPPIAAPLLPPVAAPVDAGAPGCESGLSEACSTGCDSSGTRKCVAGAWAACKPPGESCDNGVDDDCDGRVDHADFDCSPPEEQCEDTTGNGCNGDMGYGNKCAPADNENGCTADRFHAWCNRRNPALPNIWDNWIKDWVDDRCDGVVSLSGATFRCLSSNNELFECTTPLVLAFEPARRVEFLPPGQRFAFAPGQPVMSDWPTAATPWLVRDLNRNGQIDDGRELFGSNTRKANGKIAADGFDALAALDANGDGAVDAADPAFVSLGVWRDRNGDRKVGPGELTALSGEGIERLSTRPYLRIHCNPRGDCERERAAFTGAVGGELVDVYVRIESAGSWRAAVEGAGPVLACR